MTKKHLLVHNYLLRKILDKIKEIIGIEKIYEKLYQKLPNMINCKMILF